MSIKLIKLKSKFDDISNAKLKLARALLGKLKKDDLKHETNLELKERLGNYYHQIAGNPVSNNKINNLVWQFDEIVNKGNNKQYGNIADFKNKVQLRIWIPPKGVAPAGSTRKRRSSAASSSAASSSSSSNKKQKSVKKKKPKPKPPIVKKVLSDASSSGDDDDDDDDDDDVDERPTLSQFMNAADGALEDGYGDFEEDEPDNESLQKQFDEVQKYAHRLLAEVVDLKKKLKVCNQAYKKLQDVFERIKTDDEE